MVELTQAGAVLHRPLPCHGVGYAYIGWTARTNLEPQVRQRRSLIRMAAPFEIQDVAQSGYAEWREVVGLAPEGSPYQLPEYLAALAEVTQTNYRLIGVYRDRELIGGIGLYLKQTYWGVDASPRVLLYYNGPFVKPSKSACPHRQEAFRREVHTVLQSHLRELGYRRIRFKVRQPECDYRVFLQAGWRPRLVYSYVVDLHDLDAAWDNMDNNLRRLVRRCEKQGYTYTEEGSCDAFLDMHQHLEFQKQVPTYLPRPAFTRFIETLRACGIASLFQVNAPDGTPAASQLVIHGQHPIAHMLSAGAAPHALSSGCSALLRWRAFQTLVQRNCRGLDLTDAQVSSVAHFKSQLGGQVQLGIQLELPQSRLAATGEQSWYLGHRLASRIRHFIKGHKP